MKPDQPQKAQIDRMPQQTVRAARCEVASRRLLPAQPIQPGCEASLITQPGQPQAVEQGCPRSIEGGFHRCSSRAGALPNDTWTGFPKNKDQRQLRASDQAEEQTVEGRSDLWLEFAANTRMQQQAVRHGELKRQQCVDPQRAGHFTAAVQEL